MPTYQYRCPSCGHTFEEFQYITEDPIQICPECGKQTHRIISGGAGFLFKGSGFYQTDYRSKQYQADARKDKPSEAAKTSDTKPSADTKKKETGSGTSSKTKPD